jgi:signal transduction histidine kinase
LASADQEVNAYRGSLDNKEELTEAIHTIVADNLTQLVALAQRVKEAPGMADAERRYLNIAQSEMSQMRLSLDAKIMADRNSQGQKQIEGKGETFSVNEVAKTVEAELKRVGAAEGIETRVLLDDSLKADIEGSAYWVESALLAFINTSLTFTDEGFIELSLWTETSTSGEPELLARIRDAGVEWSLEDPELDHAALTILKEILEGLEASICSAPASSTGSQEHVIRFSSE